MLGGAYGAGRSGELGSAIAVAGPAAGEDSELGPGSARVARRRSRRRGPARQGSALGGVDLVMCQKSVGRKSKACRRLVVRSPHGFLITGQHQDQAQRAPGRTVPWLVALGLSSPTPHHSGCVRRW
jgi:hypothetical protein